MMATYVAGGLLPAPLAYAPVPAPFVTAHSSQVVAQNFNGLLAAAPAYVHAAPALLLR